MSHQIKTVTGPESHIQVGMLDLQGFQYEGDQEPDCDLVSSDSNEEFDAEGCIEETEPCTDVKRKLADWAASQKISHSALSELLQILVQCSLDFPRDPRTLLSTSDTCEVKDIGDGCSHHFGISNALTSLLS